MYILHLGQWSESSFGRFLLAGKAGNHWTGGWVGPSAGRDVMVKREIIAPAGNRNPAVQPVAD
jgi:hypothetical protein